MDNIDIELLKQLTDTENGTFEGAYNIRKNGQGIERKLTENVNIVTKQDVSVDTNIFIKTLL